MRRTTITHLEFFEATSPRSRPIADATHQIPAINFIIARLTLADGTSGEGYLLAFHFNPAAIRGALADVRAIAVGLEVSDTRVFNAACDQAFEYFGNTGLLRWARGVVNLAMWDAWGRHLGQPVWRLLGTHARSVPVYGSGGWLSYSTNELMSEVTEYVKRGFADVKVKVGSPERAVEWAGDGILVNAVAPGWFPSEMTRGVMDPDRRKKILARMPLHRFGEPDELAAAVLFLLSPAASYITGHELAVDGGALAFGY